MHKTVQIIFQSVFVSITLINLVGCDKEKVTYQLSEEKLTNILADIHISEAVTQHLSLSFRDSMVQIHLEQILEIHEVKRAIFEMDYQLLKRDPEKLQQVYQKVIERLNALKVKKKRGETDKKLPVKGKKEPSRKGSLIEKK